VSPGKFLSTPYSYLLMCMFLSLLLISCSKDDPVKQAFFDEKISCPSPAVDEFNGWGQSGSEHICKIKHGPFVAFEGGYVRIRGQYENGKEVGIWRWYGADGKVMKEINYGHPN
jgi:hypothetical protein